jgi:hypothetical protein
MTIIAKSVDRFALGIQSMLEMRCLMRCLIYFALAFTLAAQCPVEQRLAKDLGYLTSAELEGRGNGNKGLDLAADYIQKEYKGLGLRVSKQTAPFVSRIERGEASAAIGGKALAFGKSIEALGSSGNGSFKNAPILFAGFGLKTQAWDDFAENDPKGKAVAICRNIPRFDALKEVAVSDLALHTRIRRIANLGALAVLVLEDGSMPAKLKREEGPLAHPIPALSLPMDSLDGQWGKAKELAESISSGPATKLIPEMHLDLDLRMVHVTSQLPNITAILPGSCPEMSQEHIVLGAHLDHLGMGERHSRGGQGQLHPGADDNASGTAMVMELARQLKTANQKRTILFVHFSGEEEGLLGSAHWVQNPTVPIASVKFMVNFDMVGRLDAEKPLLHVGGLGATKAILDQSRSLAPGDFSLGSDLGFAMGGSDHMSFAAARIPSYFFFTGIHTDYHTPNDALDSLNVPGMARIADYAAKVVRDLADMPELPPFDPSTAQNNARRSSGTPRIAFGTIPDFTEAKDGFRITGTTAGSTAESIGLRAGDAITSFGGRPIANIYDFMDALGAFSGGDKAIVKWRREGKEHQAEATLRER